MSDWRAHDFAVKSPDERLTFCSQCGRPESNLSRNRPCSPREDPRDVMARCIRWLRILDDAMQGKNLTKYWPKTKKKRKAT